MGHTDMLNLTPDGGASTQPLIHTPDIRTATRDGAPPELRTLTTIPTGKSDHNLRKCYSVLM